MEGVFDTDVLVVGSGPAGGSAALFLATYGTRVMVISRHSRLADSPRAHVTNQRTLEALRDMGIEQEVERQSTPWDLMGTLTWSTSLLGQELGRLNSLGTGVRERAEYADASPCPMLDCIQPVLEPILLGTAQQRGAIVRFDTAYVSHRQHDDGVRTTVRDRLTGQEYTVRSRYLVGADGARSQVAADLDLPMVGPGPVAGALSIVFDADLTELVAHRPSNLYAMVQPGSDRAGVGLGYLRMVQPWTQWMLIWGYDVAVGPPELTDEFVRGLAHQLIGSDEVDVRIVSSSPWTVNHQYAAQLSRGRVLCAGDAVHRHPPNNGLGSNTSIQDSYNLAWKLHLLVRGLAGPALLESYDSERAPVARQVVERANQSIAQTGSVLAALEVQDSTDEQALERQLAVWRSPGAEGEKLRRALREAIALQRYQFQGHGVEMNQRYASTAVLPDGSPDPGFVRDPELYAQPSSRPGAKLPHTWVTRAGRKVSTLDLAGRGRFAVVTGIGGQVWADAARVVAEQTGLPLTVVEIGPGLAVEDPYGTWSELSGIADSGVLLVRPDLYVAARHGEAPADRDGAVRLLVHDLQSVLSLA